MIEDALNAFFAGSEPDITKEELLNMLVVRAIPAIDDYLNNYLEKEILLREWLAQPLLDFARKSKLSKRLIKQLEIRGISFVGQLILQTEEDLLRQKGMGKTLYIELIAALKEHAPKVSKHWYVSEPCFNAAIYAYAPPGVKFISRTMYQDCSMFKDDTLTA